MTIRTALILFAIYILITWLVTSAFSLQLSSYAHDPFPNATPQVPNGTVIPPPGTPTAYLHLHTLHTKIPVMNPHGTVISVHAEYPSGITPDERAILTNKINQTLASRGLTLSRTGTAAVYAINAAIYLVPALIVYAGYRTINRYQRRSNPNTCTKCGYPIDPGTTNICPECGTQTQPPQ